MKYENKQAFTLLMFSALIILLSLFVLSCSKVEERNLPEEKHLSIEELDTISNDYNSYFNSFNEEVVGLENSETVKDDIENKRTPALDGFSNIEIFDPQGNSFDGSLTIRDTVPYQRLMGHLDYYSFLESIEDKGFLSSIIKIYNFNNPDPFRGILKVSKSLSSFFESHQYETSYYLLDSTRTFIKSDNSAKVLTQEEQIELEDQLKDISSLQESSGNVEFTYQGEPVSFNYVIKNGVGIFS